MYFSIGKKEPWLISLWENSITIRSIERKEEEEEKHHLATQHVSLFSPPPWKNILNEENTAKDSKKPPPSLIHVAIVFAMLFHYYWLANNNRVHFSRTSLIQSSLTFSSHCSLLKSWPEFWPAFKSTWIVCAAAPRRFIRTTITWIVSREAC